MRIPFRLLTTLAIAMMTVSAFSAEVVLEGNDAMQFNVKEFTVKAGESVKLTLKHVGKLPKAAMGHNVVIVEKGTDAMSFGMTIPASGGTMANGYIPTDKSKIIAFTAMIGGGESVSVDFTAPTEPGSYPFMCTFPGHVAMMRGVMIVE